MMGSKIKSVKLGKASEFSPVLRKKYDLPDEGYVFLSVRQDTEVLSTMDIIFEAHNLRSDDFYNKQWISENLFKELFLLYCNMRATNLPMHRLEFDNKMQSVVKLLQDVKKDR